MASQYQEKHWKVITNTVRDSNETTTLYDQSAARPGEKLCFKAGHEGAEVGVIGCFAAGAWNS
jgi:hypothetical protein